MDSESESHSVVSDSLQPHGLYSPWNSPGQTTGVDSHSLLQGIFPTQGSNPYLPHCRQILYWLSHQEYFGLFCFWLLDVMHEHVCVKLLQSCLTLCHSIDCNPPGSFVHGILQARMLEWVAMPSSRGSSRPRNQTHVSYIYCIGRQALLPLEPPGNMHVLAYICLGTSLSWNQDCQEKYQ